MIFGAKALVFFSQNLIQSDPRSFSGVFRLAGGPEFGPKIVPFNQNLWKIKKIKIKKAILFKIGRWVQWYQNLWTNPSRSPIKEQETKKKKRWKRWGRRRIRTAGDSPSFTQLCSAFFSSVPWLAMLEGRKGRERKKGKESREEGKKRRKEGFNECQKCWRIFFYNLIFSFLLINQFLSFF